MVNDPVGDFIIQLKNAGMVRKETVSIPYSKLKHAIADKLVATGFVVNASKYGKKVKKTLDITLKYTEGGEHQIQGVQRVSKPGRRLYRGVAEIFPVKFGKGKRILSTPSGILTGEEAREKNVGGEELFIIW
ncbi:MAG: 30S ribosomal protein S8 [Candidatus Pacebacteria bacterium]|nr:30S ribosomal protein S8 [Candidatus Paceibacterota bacterium]MCF7857414.1 30S ribosomal protein S8 [Candidatus Paceibacterota bacterium]